MEDKIEIIQDFIGSYGLYLYQIDNYFAISNSFIKLVDYLKSCHKLSLNKDYANDLLFTNLCSRAYNVTLVNEIKTLPQNCRVIIDKENNSIGFEDIDYGMFSVPLDSRESLDMLDDWFYKWVGIVRQIKSKTNNIAFHLSGGFDTRIVAAIWLSANINMDDVKVISIDDGLHTHSEDFEIASKIAEKFNFQLNAGKCNETAMGFEDIEIPLMNSFYTKQCFHKEMYFKTFRYEEPLYTLTGAGGACVREFDNETPSEYIEDLKKRNHSVDDEITNSSIKLFNYACEQINRKHGISMESKDITDLYYRDVRNRLHFGKSAVETFFSNEISLNPLLDPQLHKFKLYTDECSDKNLLMALIFVRYCPELLDFEIEGGREIDARTIDYAQNINAKYPLVKRDLPEIPSIGSQRIKSSFENNCIKRKDIDGYLEKVFNSQSFEMEFEKYFSFKFYEYIHKISQGTKYYPLKSVYSAIGILKIINDINLSNLDDDFTEIQWLDTFSNDNHIEKLLGHKNKTDLIKFATARLDIKNNGDNNSIRIIENSDEYSRHSYPRWFKNDKGEGLVIESYRGNLDLELQCINDGMLEIKLKGVDVRDDNRQKLPIFINYTSFKVNGRDEIDSVLTRNDKPFLFRKKVEDLEILRIHVEWLPLNSSAIYENETDELVRKNKELSLKLEELKSRCEFLETENTELKEKKGSNGSKLKSFLRK